MPDKPVFVERVLLRAALAALGLIGLWFTAHLLKNLYLGNLISYQDHFLATTKVNFILMIFTICSIRLILKEFAFTLVELAIVLIIIGFVIAGIAGGVSMVQASRLNGVISEVRNIQTSVLNFRSRFNALPGDFTGAFAIWGSVCGINDTGASNSCNGDGDNFVEFAFAGGGGVNAGPVEELKFWQHLSLAQMVNGNFNGQNITSIRQQPSVNIPASSYRNGVAYWARFIGPIYGNPQMNFLEMGTIGTGGYTGIYDFSAISPTDAYSIDNKMDDGSAGSGMVFSFRGANNPGSTVCVTSDGTLPTSYIFTDTTNSCRMGFKVIDNN